MKPQIKNEELIKEKISKFATAFAEKLDFSALEEIAGGMNNESGSIQSGCGIAFGMCSGDDDKKL